jgi:hypothetical protein
MNNRQNTNIRTLALCIVGIIAPMQAHGFLTTSEDFEGYASGTALSQNVIVQTILGLGDSQWALFTSGGGQLSFTAPTELTTGSQHISFDLAITQQPQYNTARPITTFGDVNLAYSGLGISLVNYTEYIDPIHHEYIAVGTNTLAYDLYQIYSFDMVVDLDGHTASIYVDDVLLHQQAYIRDNYPWPVTGITFDNSTIRQAEYAIDNFSWVSTIPEPSSLILFILGAFTISGRKYRKRKGTQQGGPGYPPQGVGSPDP